MRKPSPALREARSVAALWESRARQIKARYDVLESGSKLRRTPERETTGEGGHRHYDMPKRLAGVNIGRDLERNYSPAKGILHQFRANVVGSLGKLQVNANGGEEAASWFNQVWASDCDFRDELHWSTLCQNIVAAVLREGDMATVFDDGLIEDSGKLLTWESDQIVPVNEDVLAALGLKGHSQDNGLVRDRWGRVTALLVTGKRGVQCVGDRNDVTAYMRGTYRLPRNPWRLNQGRGVPCIITAAASFLDVYEMLGRELQTAKRAAAQWAYVHREDAVDDWDAPGTKPEQLPENDGKSASTTSADGANSATVPEARNYESLEAFTGGYTDYGAVGDKVEFSPADRPNVHMPEFIEAVHCHAGMAFGLARAYALMRADTSYTAFRGDMIMSWQGAFYPMQKWLEREVADWVARKALAWAMRSGVNNRRPQIKPLPAGWERSLSWTWPTMPEVDELDAANAVAQALKNGTTDYAALLGPDWRKRLESFAEQLDVIRKLNIPAGVLELKSGGAANPKKTDSGEGGTE
jgi:capsid protein